MFVAGEARNKRSNSPLFEKIPIIAKFTGGRGVFFAGQNRKQRPARRLILPIKESGLPMPLQTIDPFELKIEANQLWEDGLLLTAGDLRAGRFNTMTVGWGGIGMLWSTPTVTVYVRPTRYTFEFMEAYDTFTLTAFPARYSAALNLLGTNSGRDGDKISAARLTPVAAEEVAAPAFAEANLVIACRKIYWADLDPAHFSDTSIVEHYPNKDFHRQYIGEVLSIKGDSQFR